MDREDILKDIITRFNNGEGTVTDLLAEYDNYNKDKFYRDLKKYGITKDNSTDKYIFEEVEGQIDLLEAEEPEEVIHRIPDIFPEILGQQNPKADTEVTETKVVETVPDDPEDKPGPEVKADKPDRKKKTFEIDASIEPYIKIEAIKEGVTLNDWVNNTLWRAISDDTRNFIDN